jgi:hypothetical protein
MRTQDNMRTFVFTWFRNDSHGQVLERHSTIKVSNKLDFAAAAKAATDLFCVSFGSLKQNTIVSIQEMKDGVAVGEPIVPQSDNAVVPTGR